MKTVWIVCPHCDGRKIANFVKYAGCDTKHVVPKHGAMYPPTCTFEMGPCPECEGTGKVKWGWIEE